MHHRRQSGSRCSLDWDDVSRWHEEGATESAWRDTVFRKVIEPEREETGGGAGAGGAGPAGQRRKERGKERGKDGAAKERAAGPDVKMDLAQVARLERDRCE